jgi:outer membrane protein
MRISFRLFVFVAALALISMAASAQTVQTLTLQQAEQLAIQNHPQIQVATAEASLADAQKRQVRASYFPTVNGSITGAEANDLNRIGAGVLNDPRIFPKFAQGIAVNQLVTDFGHTYDLVKSANLHEQAQQENVITTRANVLLLVDQSYYGVLRAQALLRVAQQTVGERQLVSNQVTQMAANQLKSQLDVTFANVDLAQAQLLLIQAQNNLQSSYADLTTALGFADQRTYQLMEPGPPPGPPANLAGLIQQAVMNRPELVSLRYEVNSAQTFVAAERDLWYPSITAVGAAGLIPLHANITTTGLDNQYAAAGFDVNFPIFNGHLFGALRNEAMAHSLEQQQTLRNELDQVVRDVNQAWNNANSGYQSLSEVQQLVNQATEALSLATSRYQLGLSSIVELTQSQLNLTQAQIEQVNATYDYQTELALVNYSIGNLR